MPAKATVREPSRPLEAGDIVQYIPSNDDNGNSTYYVLICGVDYAKERFSGVVLADMSGCGYKTGYFSDRFGLDAFKLFNGVIELTNSV